MNNKILNLDDVITFGKYKGHTISWITEMDYSYIDWCNAFVKDFKVSEEVKSKCLESWRKEYDSRPVKNFKQNQIKSIDGGYELSQYDFDLGLCGQD
jgi:hypothetical protein